MMTTRNFHLTLLIFFFATVSNSQHEGDIISQILAINIFVFIYVCSPMRKILSWFSWMTCQSIRRQLRPLHRLYTYTREATIHAVCSTLTFPFPSLLSTTHAIRFWRVSTERLHCFMICLLVTNLHLFISL